MLPPGWMLALVCLDRVLPAALTVRLADLSPCFSPFAQDWPIRNSLVPPRHQFRLAPLFAKSSSAEAIDRSAV